MPTERQISTAWTDLDELVRAVHPDNPKRHDQNALDRSLDRFGFVAPVIMNDAGGRIIVGHGRVEALVAMRTRGAEPPLGILQGTDGEWLVPTVRGIRFSDDDALAYLVADNRLTELGGWHDEGLASVLSKLAETVGGLDGIGFTMSELSDVLAGLEQTPFVRPPPDEVPDDPSDDDLYVEAGQLWRLDGHRVYCGDATKDADVEHLLEGHTADMAVTDAPYNVNYGKHGGAGRGRRPIENDALSAADWESFVRAWTGPLLQHVNGAVYVFMSSKEWPTVSRLLEEAGGHWSDTIIWSKDRFVLGRADYQRQYEPIWYGWREGSAHYWCGDRNQSDIWAIPRPTASELHPTMKPVALIERALTNSSPKGAIVLDPFLGSGTTLVAAERVGRRCYGIELDPRYVQVAIERWQRQTGRTAVREEGD